MLTAVFVINVMSSLLAIMQGLCSQLCEHRQDCIVFAKSTHYHGVTTI